MKIATPKYVLRNEGDPVCPPLGEASTKLIGKAIFGFSDKLFYDEFAKKNKHTLMPYPLVKGYLIDQMAEGKGDTESSELDESLYLVFVDAGGPEAEVIYAATMSKILTAYDVRAKQLLASHVLRFDSKSNAYELEAIQV